MSDFNFKDGDKVYYPMATNEVLQVTSDLRVFYLGTDATDVDDKTNAKLDFNGKLFRFHHNPSFFPATQEWYEKLVQVYPDLEPPPKRKEPKEIIQAMFNDGWNLINYRIYSNAQQALNSKKKNKVITRQNFHTMNCDDYFTRYAYCSIEIIDPKTGKTIIDYVDGKIILGD